MAIPPIVEDTWFSSLTPYYKNWLRQVFAALGSSSGKVAWTTGINFSGSNITDLAAKAHNNLDSLQGGAGNDYQHLTTAQYNLVKGIDVAVINTTGLTGNVTASTLYAVPSTGAGIYRVSSLVVETTAGSLSSTLPNVQIVYTDNDTGGSITIDSTPVLSVAGIGQTGALTANAIGTTSTGVIVINAKASTTIQYQTVNYASNAAGMTYALHIRLDDL